MQINPGTFYHLTLEERIKVIQQQGEYLTHIKKNSNFLDLYAVDKYLVEVNHNASLFKIDGIYILPNRHENLPLYAERVDISDVYKTKN